MRIVSLSKTVGQSAHAGRGVIAAICVALFVAGCAGGPPDTYDLAAPSNVETRARSNAHLVVMAPKALSARDSERVVVRGDDGRISYLSGAQWSDKLGPLVGSRLLQAFENSGRIRAVGQQGDGLKSDYILVSDIRSFDFVTAPAFRGDVELSIKLINDRNGRVVSSRVFTSSQPAETDTSSAAVTALNSAFDEVASDIVAWVLQKI